MSAEKQIAEKKTGAFKQPTRPPKTPPQLPPEFGRKLERWIPPPQWGSMFWYVMDEAYSEDDQFSISAPTIAESQQSAHQ